MSRAFRIALLAFGLAGPAAAQGDLRPVPRPEGLAAPQPALAAPIVSSKDAVARPKTVSAPGTQNEAGDTQGPASDLLVMSSKAPVPRPLGLLDDQGLRLALSAGGNGDWDTARALAAKEGPVAETLIEWQRLRAGKGDFAAYRTFLAQHSDWPGLDLMRRRGEGAIPAGGDPAPVLAYFAAEPPQTAWGVLRLAEAHLATGNDAAAQQVLATAWTRLELSADEEARLLAAHGDGLKPHHAARLDHLLWQRDGTAAARMLDRVDDGQAALGRARLALQRNSGGVDRLIEAVPKELRTDPGLAYDRMDWQIGQRRRETAGGMILAASRSARTLGRPEAWANWRRILARQEMRDGSPRRAYALASRHHLTDGADFADLEWLAGYLALHHLKDPAGALSHFERFAAAVDTPISLGRAGYWRGRAHEALGNAEAAMAAYRDGARHQTSFYGLLAAEKAGVEMDPALAGSAPTEGWRQAGFARGDVFRAAQLFFDAGRPWETGRFLRHLAETVDPDEAPHLADYAASLGDPHQAIRVGKVLAGRGLVATNAYYPLTRLGPEELPVSEALALSIARRESEFHAAAVSPAGARGIMQLMPTTAQAMARKVGVPYSRARLTTDPAYNATLGSAYLAHLIEQFGNNIVLVSVGYNAGPHRASRWIEANGDPRDASVDVVDWIEHIPYRETRNYVMRVAESLPVYRARLLGHPVPIRLTEELTGR